jgi:GNAT superfamily N-acetyltransferase
MYEVAVAAYKEHGGHLARQTESFVRWQVHELGSPATRLDLTPVAVAGETVVGFATLRTFPDAEAGEQRMVAVAPEWRGRGIAAALLAGQIRDARKVGLRRLCSWVPDDAPAAYEKLGFEVHDRFVAFEGPLA